MERGSWDHAGERGNFVVDGESVGRVVDATLRIYRRLRESGRENVGCVLQAYLYQDPERPRRCSRSPPNLRLVKGAYLEPPDLAYP